MLESRQGRRKPPIANHPTTIMKTKSIITLISITLLGASSAFAQGGPGRGYGGPPKSDEERAARQAQCQRTDCPNKGQGQGQRKGWGQGQGQGKGWGQGQGQGNGQGRGFRRGPRDGSGPRGGTGSCPINN